MIAKYMEKHLSNIQDIVCLPFQLIFCPSIFFASYNLQLLNTWTMVEIEACTVYAIKCKYQK